jgi:hypothetical protein
MVSTRLGSEVLDIYVWILRYEVVHHSPLQSLKSTNNHATINTQHHPRGILVHSSIDNGHRVSLKSTNPLPRDTDASTRRRVSPSIGKMREFSTVASDPKDEKSP